DLHVGEGDDDHGERPGRPRQPHGMCRSHGPSMPRSGRGRNANDMANPATRRSPREACGIMSPRTWGDGGGTRIGPRGGGALTGTFLGMKYCLPVMRRQGSGAIVNTASISGTAGDYGLSSYNAAKAGVINLTRSAAIENAKFGIRVNCVCPGTIDTRAPQLLGGDRADEIRRRQAAANPVARMGQADEIANAIFFLGSDES